MTSYTQAIKKAIKAAGFKESAFEVHRTGFEPNWAAAGLAGVTGDLDHRSAVNRQNRRLKRVAKALEAAGYKVTTYTAGHGGKFVEVNEYHHGGHRAEYSEKHSVWHY